MNYVMMMTHFCGTSHDMTLCAHGTKFYVTLSQGGPKYDDTEYEDDKVATECSPKFDTYQDAADFYCKLAKEFGGGDYDWEDRARFVREGRMD